MKKVKIFWTPFALKNLDLIKEYIMKASYSEKIANNHVRKLINTVEQLQFAPESGQTEELLEHLNQNFGI